MKSECRYNTKRLIRFTPRTCRNTTCRNNDLSEYRPVGIQTCRNTDLSEYRIPMFPSLYVPRYMFPSPMFPSRLSMFPSLYVPGSYVPRSLCSPDLCFPVPMFPDTYVPRYLSSPEFFGRRGRHEECWNNLLTKSED